jgi:glyoxylase-like metal-dependent hydrolase (beta-lactamase superfamily II)
VSLAAAALAGLTFPAENARAQQNPAAKSSRQWLSVDGLGPVYPPTPARRQKPGETPDTPDQPMRVEKIKDDIYVIRGPFSLCGPGGCRGTATKVLTGLWHEAGDVIVRVTPAGVILVDDKYSYMAPELLEKVKSITSQPVKYVLNSHYHADHTGANAAMIEQGFLIATSQHMRDEFLGIGARPGRGDAPIPVPQIVFGGDFGAIYLGGKEAQMWYLGHAHTGGDTFNYFPDLKVMHTGDCVMSGAPNIDYAGGASAVEWPKTLYNLLKLDFDVVVPGHGPIYTRQYVLEYAQKFEIMNQRMIDLIKAGVPKEEIAERLKVDDLGWADTVSSGPFHNSLPGYYDEMSAVVAAQTARARAQ